jgi:alkylation response protein AidB-like acyl-CoA dehydrogenase
MMEKNYEDVLAWARETEAPGGGRVIDQEWVQLNLARVRAGIEYLTLLNWKVAALEAAGEAVNPADASSIKVFGTEFFTDAYRLLGEVVGQNAVLSHGSPAAALSARLNRGAQGTLILTFGGGVNEIQRDLIAMFGLGMPRMPRM